MVQRPGNSLQRSKGTPVFCECHHPPTYLFFQVFLIGCASVLKITLFEVQRLFRRE